ncbi:MAG: thioesterase [Catenulispora sp.]|nr:thioesterase [Catenulispora sp.]
MRSAPDTTANSPANSSKSSTANAAPTSAGRTPGDGVTPYLTARPDPTAPLRLFCFHHAGGSGSVFADWQSVLAPNVSVQPVQLPGRERRVREPRITDMARLTEELDRELGPHMDGPCAFYGHSMGGLVAWHLVLHRRRTGQRLPRALLVGACNPPHRPPLSASTKGMTRDQLVAWMQEMGGISELVLRYPEWVDAAVSLLRDDLELCDSHPHAAQLAAPPAPLPVPLYGFVGADDPGVGPDAMADWLRYTEAQGEVFPIPGGHLFFRDSPVEFLSRLRSVLTRLGSVPAGREGTGPR